MIRFSGRLLAGTNYSIQKQFPDEIERRRKPPYPILRQARRNQQRAVLVSDRLYVDGREVRAPEQMEAASADNSRKLHRKIVHSNS